MDPPSLFGSLGSLTGLTTRNIFSLDTNALEDLLDTLYGNSIDKVNDINSARNGYIEHSYSPHMYNVKHNNIQYIIKFSKDPVYSSLINQEYRIYETLYRLPNYEANKQYFLEGVIGGDHEYKGYQYSYILFPFVENQSLEEYSQTKQSVSHICTILQQVNLALVFLLKNGLCHGDMHAGNVLILPDRTIKVIDFDKSGDCDEKLETGYQTVRGRNAVRRNVDFIGVPSSSITGFFVLCKHIFTLQDLPVERMDRIIQEYLTDLPIEQAYAKMYAVLEAVKGQNGQGRRTKKRAQKRRRSLPASTKNRNK
jgi:serine/threonine protein kinase